MQIQATKYFRVTAKPTETSRDNNILSLQFKAVQSSIGVQPLTNFNFSNQTSRTRHNIPCLVEPATNNSPQQPSGLLPSLFVQLFVYRSMLMEEKDNQIMYTLESRRCKSQKRIAMRKIIHK